MTFGINGAELIILVVLAVLVLGPEKLPEYTRKLTEWIRNLRAMAEGAKSQFKEETGTDFDEINWRRYDPRQYDPRRIIRDALSEPVDGPDAGRAARPSGAGSTAALDDDTRESLRTDLEAARSERDALRDDLREMDPRALFFGSSRRSAEAPEGQDPRPGAEAAESVDVPVDVPVPEGAVEGTDGAEGPGGSRAAAPVPAVAATVPVASAVGSEDGPAASRPLPGTGAEPGAPAGRRATPFDPEAT
ncbi:Sec-independent protein translocase TatB [Citricoccus sp. SGAir0253]|uniref:twin-arginine translocase TatA/TatE family subunit n=1 Tax=Citricoccus sp. SGAir0253 TaxID=2567881 RepID=UPI0010CCCC12|nr:twin-arginine translocase TatA/TatE family subunit [Citricoccus sp. SGAir0253]QCU77701.1 Sec-independent protein translocase TatB [Citricoccus sp. SGAir0253]